MPLFGRKQEPVHTQPAPVQTQQNGNRFSTSSRTSPRHSSGGFFSRRRSSSSISSSDLETNNRRSGTLHKTGGGGVGGGLFNRNRNEDPSIAEARNRVIAAEQAERDADHALQLAKNSVREAREHVRRLELEAEAEAKAARVKADHAKDLGRRAKPLGRRFY